MFALDATAMRRRGARAARVLVWLAPLAITVGCGGATAESYEFVYGPVAGSAPAVFQRLTRAIAARGNVIVEADAAQGRVVVAVRSAPGANAPARVVFQCYRGGWVGATVEGAEALGGSPRRIRVRRWVRDGYEAIAVGMLDALADARREATAP